MRLVLLTLVAFLAVPAAAQQHAGHHGASPYAAETARPIKALSAEETAGLLEGRGMGLARAAELNGYPGPMHVLELAGSLALSAEQRAETERVMRAMREETRRFGAQLVEIEGHLDALFVEGHATPEAVDRMTADAAEVHGRIRAAHLRAHVATRALLTPDQIAAYSRLRGYTD